MDDAAETVRPKGKKKKKKSSTKKQDSMISKGPTFADFEEPEQNQSPDRSSPSPQKSIKPAETLMVVDDMDITTVKTKKSRKSSSKSKAKKKKTLKTKQHVDEAPDELIVVNNVNLAGFGKKNAAP